MSTKKFIIASLTGVSMMLSSVATFAAEQAAPPRASLVVTAPVESGMINPLQNYVGTLYYDKQSELASEFEGIISAVHFKEGERVRKGELLVDLDSRVLESNIHAKRSAVAALKAEVTRQERDLERTKALYERNSVSQSNYDQVFYATEQLRAELEAASSELASMQIEHEKMRIKAPFDAVVAGRHVDVGEWAAKGTAVATLVDPSSIEGRVSIPARYIDLVRQRKAFVTEIEGQEVQAGVKAIIPVADTATRSFVVELNVPKERGLIEGMRIDVKVPTLRETEALLVPRDAVIKRFGQMVVFTAVDGKAMMFPVQVIGYKTTLAAIEGAGLQKGMRVIIKGNERVFPNMPVQEKE